MMGVPCFLGGLPIAAVLAHSHGTAFVFCYTASYIFVSLGGEDSGEIWVVLVTLVFR